MKEAANPTPPALTGTVKSDDGTTIGYSKLGQGPGLALVHGAGQSSQNLRNLADGLSGTFTVYVPDRRDRGMSGPYGECHGLRTEIEDLRATWTAMGATYVFGLSAGAVIAIEAARAMTQITKLALYEPPLSFDGVVHAQWVSRYERELAGREPRRSSHHGVESHGQPHGISVRSAVPTSRTAQSCDQEDSGSGHPGRGHVASRPHPNVALRRPNRHGCSGAVGAIRWARL